MRPPSIMAGKGARVYAYKSSYPTPPGNIVYNPLQNFRNFSVKDPDNNYQTFSDWSLTVKSDLQKRSTIISHGEQYLPGIMSGDISLSGMISSEGYMGYYVGQLVTVELNWSSYFDKTEKKVDTKTLKIPVSIASIDRTTSVKDAYKVSISGKLNFIFDPNKAPDGALVYDRNGTIATSPDLNYYGYIPTTPAIADLSASPSSKQSPFYI